MTTPAAKKTVARKPPAEKAETPVISTKFASVEDIRLGMTLKDPTTSLVGIAIYKAELISGTVQFAIQPQGDGKSLPDGRFIDDFLLEFVDDGVSKSAPAIDTDVKIGLGWEIQDTITGFRGIAVEKTTYLNGCVHFTIQPEAKGGFLGMPKTRPDVEHFDHKRLKKVGDGVAPPPPRQLKKAEEPKPPEFKRSRTGGPTRSLPSRAV